MFHRKKIKNVYKKLNIFFNSIFSVIKVLFFSSYFNEKLSKIFENTNHKTKCLVLGGGPSTEKDLNRIRSLRNDYELIAINFFCNSDFFEDFKPEHYVLADDIVFSGNKFSPDHEDISKDFLNKINLVDWKIKLYIPAHFKKSWLISKVNNPFVEILKINTTPVSSYTSIERILFNLNLAMPIIESVIIMAIFISIKLNFRKIYLTGVEHDWIKDFQVNFYNESYFKLVHHDSVISEKKIDGNVYNFFESQARLFKSHKILNQYANSKNIIIINCTKNSFIDSYERFNH